MSLFLKSAALACLFAAAAAPAIADQESDQFEAEFTYTKTAPIEQTYAGFEATARKYCQREASSIRNVRRIMYLNQCRAELLDKVVMQTRSASLVALHETRSGRQMPAVSYAERPSADAAEAPGGG